MFKEIDGDLIEFALQKKFDCIAHGANCFCVMGAGIAKSIRENFTEAYSADAKTANGSYNKLGTLSIAKSGNGVYIINAYTQFQPGAHANRIAIDMCLDKIAYIMQEWKLKSLGLPLIGCGIGGLDENIMVPRFKSWATEQSFDVTLVRFNK